MNSTARAAVDVGPSATARPQSTLVGLTVATVVAGVATLPLTSHAPAAGASPATVARAWADDGMLTLGAFVKIAAGLLFAVLAARFAAELRASGDDGAAPRVCALGGAVLAVGLAVDAAIVVALVDRADDVSPAAAQALNVLYNSLWPVFIAGCALMVGGIGASARRTGTLPTWLATGGVVLAVLAPLGPGGFATFFLSGPFLIAAAILLARD